MSHEGATSNDHGWSKTASASAHILIGPADRNLGRFEGTDISIESPVLCADLDKAVTPTELLYEVLVLVLRLRPWLLFYLPFWLFRGHVYFRKRLSDIAGTRLRFDLLPRNQVVLDLIALARSQGRRVELVSAAHQELLRRWDDNPAFDAVFGSEGRLALKGPEKAHFLAERHADGFAYIGGSKTDIAVWRAAHERFGVGLSSRTLRRLAREGVAVHDLSPRRSWLPALFREMRPHQWVKNLLVFVSVGLALNHLTPVAGLRFLATFLGFCLLTSGTYIINDLTDMTSDRLHPRKRFRPLASGALPIPVASAAAIVLIAGGIGVGLAASLQIGGTFLAYLGLTLAYSFGLKRMAILDVLTVAILFTTRIVAGAFAYPGPVSRWIIVFSIFFFTSLALMKRTVETASLAPSGISEVAGRGYRAEDHQFLLMMGIAFGVGAIIVFSLYVSDMVSGYQQYRSPDALWGATAVLGYWIIRMWLKTARGQMDDDPILYAVRDPVSIALGIAIYAVAMLAQLL